MTHHSTAPDAALSMTSRLRSCRSTTVPPNNVVSWLAIIVAVVSHPERTSEWHREYATNEMANPLSVAPMAEAVSAVNQWRYCALSHNVSLGAAAETSGEGLGECMMRLGSGEVSWRLSGWGIPFRLWGWRRASMTPTICPEPLDGQSHVIVRHFLRKSMRASAVRSGA